MYKLGKFSLDLPSWLDEYSSYQFIAIWKIRENQKDLQVLLVYDINYLYGLDCLMYNMFPKNQNRNFFLSNSLYSLQDTPTNKWFK